MHPKQQPDHRSVTVVNHDLLHFSYIDQVIAIGINNYIIKHIDDSD
jgi:hypothetical protein